MANQKATSGTAELKSKVVGLIEIEWRKWKWLQNDNLKELTEERYQRLATSLVSNSFIQPFFVWGDNDKTGFILDGKHRNLTMLKMEKDGYKDTDGTVKQIRIPDKLPALVLAFKNKKEAARAILAYSSKYALETEEGLYEFMNKFDISFKDVAATYDFPQIKWDDFEANFFDGKNSKQGKINTEAQADEDGFALPDEIETEIEIGDLIEIGQHRILCDDATNKAAVEQLMNRKKAELAFTSPPYLDMRNYKGGKDLSLKNLVEFIPAFYEYCEYMVINLGMKRENNEVVEYWDEFKNRAKQCGYKFLSWNVWSKEGFGGSIGNMNAMFAVEHEWLFVFGKNRKDLNLTRKNKNTGDVRTANKRGKDDVMTKGREHEIKEYSRMSSVIHLDYARAGADEFTTQHPAPFPVRLPSEYITAMTNKGEIVVEPFGGSGSTMVACEQLGRICYAMDLTPEYCQLHIDRMLHLNPKLPVKINGKKYTPKKKPDTAATDLAQSSTQNEPAK